MENWTEIRRRVWVESVSRRQILRETGMHWRTLQKMLNHSEPPGYQQSQPRAKKKLAAYVGRIEPILQGDQAMPRKQRHTAKRIWERLQAEGFTGGYTIIKDPIRELTAHRQEVFVPLVHPPGEAQVDFGQALVNLNGPLRKVCFFVLALPYSDASFVMAFERECTETFWEGPVQAFAFFGGAPKRISYDHTKIAVAEIIGGGKGRRLTPGFCQLKSHYLFAHHFCRPARGHEKGGGGAGEIHAAELLCAGAAGARFGGTQCAVAAAMCGGSGAAFAGSGGPEGGVAQRGSSGVSGGAEQSVCGLPATVHDRQQFIAGAL